MTDIELPDLGDLPPSKLRRLLGKQHREIELLRKSSASLKIEARNDKHRLREFNAKVSRSTNPDSSSLHELDHLRRINDEQRHNTVAVGELIQRRERNIELIEAEMQRRLASSR